MLRQTPIILYFIAQARSYPLAPLLVTAQTALMIWSYLWPHHDHIITRTQ